MQENTKKKFGRTRIYIANPPENNYQLSPVQIHLTFIYYKSFGVFADALAEGLGKTLSLR